EQVCIKCDFTILGLSKTRLRTRSGMAGRRLPDVTDDGRPVLSQGPVTGSLNASSPPVSGSYIYNWRVALASAPTTYVKQQQTTAASNTFEGLTPDQVYNVELNGVGTAGTTDWSGPGELMII